MLKIRMNQGVGLKYCNDSKAFIKRSNDMDGIHKTIEEYIPNKEPKKLIAFGDMIGNKKLNPLLTELFIRGRKLKISLFLPQNLILLYQKILC